MPGFFTMAVLMCTQHSPCGSFSWKTKHWWLHSHSATLLPLQHTFPFSQDWKLV